MALPSYADLVAGRSAADLFTELLALLKGKGLPTTEWDTGEPIPVILRWGLSPILNKVYTLASVIARGGILTGARELAEADLAKWEASASTTFLGWLAKDFFAVTPKPPTFTVGTERFTNNAAAARTVTTATIVATLSGLRYRVTDPAAPIVLAPGETRSIQITAETTGSSYNVAAQTITRLITSLPGVTVSNQPAPPNVSWITNYGAGLERPREVEARCRFRWARLSRLQVSPVDAYRSAALDPDLTGTAAIRKVAVWKHFSPVVVGNSPNAVTLFLAGEGGPVTIAQADQVYSALRPYIGLHDELFVRPCIAASYAPAGTVRVASPADVAAVTAGLQTVFSARQADLQIGQPVLAWEVRTWVGDRDTAPALARVVNFVETLVDYIPVKNALVALSPSNLIVSP